MIFFICFYLLCLFALSCLNVNRGTRPESTLIIAKRCGSWQVIELEVQFLR